MRQAGRYLPEYRALRAKVDFESLTRTPELAAEVTLQPLRRFELDAAILFSDIMTPLQGMGVKLAFEPGPVVREPIRSAAQIEALPTIIGGRAGGFPGWVNECFAGGRQSRGVERARITYEIAPDLGHWGVEIIGKVKAWAKAISGPTSPPGKYPQLINAPGSETGPGPQLVTWGKATILSVDAHGFKFDYTLNSAKHIPFDWEGP